MNHTEAKALTQAITADYPNALLLPDRADGEVTGIRFSHYVTAGNRRLGNEMCFHPMRDYTQRKDQINTGRVSK